MRTKLLKWSSFGPHFTQKSSVCPFFVITCWWWTGTNSQSSTSKALIRSIVFLASENIKCSFSCIKWHLTGSTCPAQYTNYAGDVPGWGSIRSLLSINNVASCARNCDLTSGCCSFEYSPTERRCNLNTECKPTTAAVHKDYTFCVKGIKTKRHSF